MMNLRPLLVGLALVISGWAQNAPPGDAAHVEKMADLRKLMEMTGGDKIANQMFDQMAASMKASTGQNGPAADKFLQEFRKEMDFKKIEEIVMAVYDKYLTADDVKGLVQFYQSPPGKHMLEAMPQINADMIGKIMPLAQELAQKAMKRMQQPEPK